MANVALNYERHITNVTNIGLATRYTINAISHKQASDAENPTVKAALEKMGSQLRALSLSSLQPAPTEKQLSDAMESITQVLLAPRESAKPLVLNFSLVMLCTEMEVFIAHVVNEILVAVPAMLKGLASQKNISASELIDSGSYESAVQRLRDKVKKEVLDANTRDMFIKHLAERFGLFDPADLYSRHSQPGGVDISIKKLEEVFDKRHRIVHEGELPISGLEEFDDAKNMFGWTITFLARRASTKYHLATKDFLLTGMCNLYGIK